MSAPLGIASTMDIQHACGSATERHSLGWTDPPATTAAVADSADQLDAAASVVTPSAADRLHRHALECIFAFLDLRELATTLRVSRDWLVAVGSMRRMELAVSELAVSLGELTQSTTARHVAMLGGDSNKVHVSAADLFALADRMAHLRSLHCELGMPSDLPLNFPHALRRLVVDLVGPADCDAIQVNGIIAVISRLPLLEDLTITVPAMTPLLSFAPLVALPRLRDLCIQTLWGRFPTLTDAQVDDLRALPQLHKFLMNMTIDVLRRLVRQPHQLQWQQISLPQPLDDMTAELLPQLPSLTQFVYNWIECEHFDWLRGLPNLTDVEVGLMVDDAVRSAVRTAAVVAGLQCCTNIEILALNCTDLTAAHLTELLPRLPRLRKLYLHRLSIESLSFVAQLPLTSQLSVFRLWYCDRLPLAELHHVHSLRNLEQLELYGSFTAPLDEHMQTLLTPPSIFLPRLEQFEYTPPDMNGD